MTGEQVQQLELLRLRAKMALVEPTAAEQVELAELERLHSAELAERESTLELWGESSFGIRR